MDAELNAAKRIVQDTQSMTVYMDLKEMSHAAVDEACLLAKGEIPHANAEFDNRSGDRGVNAKLITGQIVTPRNLDKFLIENGYFTREQVYGDERGSRLK